MKSEVSCNCKAPESRIIGYSKDVVNPYGFAFWKYLLHCVHRTQSGEFPLNCSTPIKSTAHWFFSKAGQSCGALPTASIVYSSACPPAGPIDVLVLPIGTGQKAPSRIFIPDMALILAKREGKAN